MLFRSELVILSAKIDAVTRGELNLSLPEIMEADEAGTGFDDSDERTNQYFPYMYG